ncbi:MAG: carbohydrate kinase [Fusobacteriaceae bacterium]|nr:carbohydrate kinase [Fusobacteriaceae bacterium]
MSIICIGELLIDFISQNIGNSLATSHIFLKKAGGAPANVAAVISRLGGKGLFCGKVGQDAFGVFLEQTLLEHGVDCSLLVKDSNVPTTLAFVSLEENGERDFSFVRGADKNLEISDINILKVDEADILHFGSATGFLDGALKDTYFTLLNYGIDNKKIISFDPNYRSAFWKNNKENFVKYSMDFIKHADILKISEEELYILTDISDFHSAVKFLHKMGAKLITVTLGKNGTFVSNGIESETIPSIKVNSIDSTGAGDAFIGAFLYYLSENNLNLSNFDNIKNYIAKANIVAAKVCTKMGAMEALSAINE